MRWEQLTWRTLTILISLQDLKQIGMVGCGWLLQ